MRTLCPEFKSATEYPDFVLNTHLDLAALLHTASVFGNAYQQAMIFYAACTLKMLKVEEALAASTGGVSGSGPLTKIKAGDLELSFGAGSSGSVSASGTLLPDSVLAANSYGRLYLAIRNTRSAKGPGLIQVS